MGKGLVNLTNHKKSIYKYILKISLILISLISLTIISVDYYLVENRQSKIWMPLALEIREKVYDHEKIVSVSNVDPTLLNLARRQGWLTPASEVNTSNLDYWDSEGANYLIGSLNWEETYAPLERNGKERLKNIICNKNKLKCPKAPNFTYIVSIKELIDKN